MKHRYFAWLSLLMAAIPGCEPPFAGCQPPVDLTDDSLPLDGGADAGATCPPGRYVVRDQLWQGPYYLWTGPNDAQALGCPLESNGVPLDAYADLVAPPDCLPCTCELSTGLCALPSVITANTTGCNISGGTPTSFDPPANWDGKCDTTSHVDPGVAVSVWIAPMTVTQEACSPIPPIAARSAVASKWKILGRSCEGWNWLPTQNGDTFCIPDGQQAPKGFQLCIAREGTWPCNNPAWANRHVFYQSVDDERVCEDCTCGPPMGSMCTAMISLNKDPACTAPVAGQISISSAKPACVDLSPSGQALVSKHATQPTYIPGTCEPTSNKAQGTANPAEPITFCCQ